MSYTIKQYRYYGDGSSKNYPEGLSKSSCVIGDVFKYKDEGKENYARMVKLGIQTFPGIKFYLNGSDSPMIVGSSGIFELDMSENLDIWQLRFDRESFELTTANKSQFYLIVDAIYQS